MHAAILSPVDTRLYRHSSTSHHRRERVEALQLPDYDSEKTVVLFPEDKVKLVLLFIFSSRSLSTAHALKLTLVQSTDVVGQCPPFERVVVLDGSWRKARAMLRHPKLRGLRRVKLPLDVRSSFWCACHIPDLPDHPHAQEWRWCTLCEILHTVMP